LEIDDLPIVVSEEGEESLYCNICNHRLLQDPTVKSHYSCTTCGIDYNPNTDPIRHGKEMETIEGPIILGQLSNETLVAYPNDPNEEYLKGKPVELKGGFKALAGKGIKITNYNETIPK
jgi:hypothetical protein